MGGRSKQIIYFKSNVAEILRKVDLAPGKDYQILSLSFDPDDTTEMALKARTDFVHAILILFWVYVT
jgi:hypothetical protein